MAKIVLLRAIGINIINTCNFNCDGCCSFSNYDFSDYQRWEDYKDIYTRWAEKVEFSGWELIGGEPTLNPTYLEWIVGLTELWPNSNGYIRTNGSTIKPSNKKLYNLLKDLNKPITVDISYHNAHREQEVLDNIKGWLEGPLTITRYPEKLSDAPEFPFFWEQVYQNIKAESWPDCKTLEDWELLPENIKKECIEVFNFSPEIFTKKYLGYKFIDSNGIVVRTHQDPINTKR